MFSSHIFWNFKFCISPFCRYISSHHQTPLIIALKMCEIEKNVEREGVRELSLQSYANLFWKTSSAPSPKLHPTNLNFGYSYFWLIRGLLDPYVYQCVQLGPSLFSIRISNLAMHICCQPTFHSSTL